MAGARENTLERLSRYASVARRRPKSSDLDCDEFFQLSWIVTALVSVTASITNLPADLKTAIELISLCMSIPIHYVPSIKKRRSFLEAVRAEHSKPTQSGGTFILRSISGMRLFSISVSRHFFQR